MFLSGLLMIDTGRHIVMPVFFPIYLVLPPEVTSFKLQCTKSYVLNLRR